MLSQARAVNNVVPFRVVAKTAKPTRPVEDGYRYPSAKILDIPALVDHYHVHNRPEIFDVPFTLNITQKNAYQLRTECLGYRLKKICLEENKKYGPGEVVEVWQSPEAAAWILKRLFGIKDDMFVTDGASLPACYEDRDGYSRIISGDLERDCITIRTDICPISIEGINIVEVAVWAPGLYRHIRRIAHGIPEGIGSVYARIPKGNVLAMVASPLEIEIELPDYRTIPPSQYNEKAREALEAALENVVS